VKSTAAILFFGAEFDVQTVWIANLRFNGPP